MTYRLTGRSVEMCSCYAPCPCVFGQSATYGKCEGVIAFAIEEGDVDGVDVAGTSAIFAGAFSGIWSDGNYTAALILDSKCSEKQQKALEQVFSGALGGDAANLAHLVGEMKGVYTADIEYRLDDQEISLSAGDIVEARGSILRSTDGNGAIEVSGVHHPPTTVIAGSSTKSKVDVEGLSFDNPGYGLYVGPFSLRG